MTRNLSKVTRGLRQVTQILSKMTRLVREVRVYVVETIVPGRNPGGDVPIITINTITARTLRMRAA